MKNFNGKPVACWALEEARRHARNLGETRLMIIYSPHARNKNGDYFIDAPDTMIRSWETELFVGLGKDA